MRKLFLTLYFKLFITMTLLASIGVLAFYLMSQRQQQIILQQHSTVLVSQIQAYFETLDADLSQERILSNELIKFQKFSGIQLEIIDEDIQRFSILPNQQIEHVFHLAFGETLVKQVVSYDQQTWIAHLALIIRKRMSAHVDQTLFLDAQIKGLTIQTDIFNSEKFLEHQLNLLKNDLPIFNINNPANRISVSLLLDNDRIITLSIPNYPVQRSFEVLVYTILMVMFVGMFFCILFIKPIENRINKLLKNLDKKTDYSNQSKQALPLNTTFKAPKDEIDQIYLKVDQMMQRMHQLANDQQEMTRAVSHEFRTPIVKMGFHVELLQDFVDSDDESIVGLKQNMKELHTLVDELLLYSNLEQSLDVSFEMFDLKSSSLSLIEQLQSISECQLVLKMEEGIQIKANERYLIRAMQNLITNAQRYAKQKIVINISEVANQVQIRIEDDGPGLTDAQKQTVFEPFKVLEESRNKKLAGHGLGLAIVKRIVLLHGGKAFVDDPIELSGASFVIHVPKRSF